MAFSNLQDIPKEVLSLALRYHPDQYIYSILTEVSEQLNTAAGYYKSMLQTRKSVLILKGTPQLITTYSKANSLSSVFLEKLSGVIIWNWYFRKSYKLMVCYSDCESVLFLIRQVKLTTHYYEETIYKYDMSNSRWNHIISLQSRHMRGAVCCFIKKNTIILTGGESLPPMGVPSNMVNLVNIGSGIFTECKTRLPFSIGFPHLVQLEEKKVMLLGGRNNFNLSHDAPSQRVLQGTLSEDGCDVIWTELNPVNIKTFANIAFKLQHQIILAYRCEDRNQI